MYRQKGLTSPAPVKYPGADDYTLIDANFRSKKFDTTVKRRSGKDAWPCLNNSEVGPVLTYSYNWTETVCEPRFERERKFQAASIFDTGSKSTSIE